MSDTVLGWLFGGWSFGQNDTRGEMYAAGSKGRPASEKSEDESVRARVAPDAHDTLRSATDRDATGRDAVLLARIQAGDETALAQLLRAYAEPLYLAAYHRLGDGFDAEEVVQELFVSIWERRRSLVIRESVRSYLFRSVYNRATSLQRHERVERRVRQDVTDARQVIAERSAVNQADETLLESDLLAVVRRALASVAPRAREIYLLHHEQGLPAPQIAAMLGVGVATVNNQLSKARQAVLSAVHRWQRSSE